MNEQEILQRDALTSAFFAIYIAGPDEKEAVAKAQGVVLRVAKKMTDAQVEECRQLGEELAHMERFWTEEQR